MGITSTFCTHEDQVNNSSLENGNCVAFVAVATVSQGTYVKHWPYI